MDSPTLITAIGLAKLKAELQDLVDVRRPHTVDRLSTARAMGDLSENSDYISAKEDLSFLDGRIDELESMVKNAQVITPSTDGTVGLGHKVTVKLNSNQAVFHIVGEWEANPAERKISHSSPMGQALMGKKVGDKVSVDAPMGKVEYTITGIE